MLLYQLVIFEGESISLCNEALYNAGLSILRDARDVQARVLSWLFSRRVVNEDAPLSTGVYSSALDTPSHPDSNDVA